MDGHKARDLHNFTIQMFIEEGANGNSDYRT